MDLISMYQEGKTATEIAGLIGVSRPVVTKRLRRLGVEVKSAKHYLKVDINKDLLYDLYINQRKTAKEIGQMFSLHDQSITRKLKQYGIPQNSPYDPAWAERKKISKDELIDLYITQRKSLNAIAKQFNVQIRCITKKLKRYSIQTRKPADHGLGTSEGEKQLVDLVRSFGMKIVVNDRTIIKPYELDVAIPELKLAIEYNGTYYHADPRFYDAEKILAIGLRRKRITAAERWAYDAMKKKLCETAGYKLVVVWEYDWTHNRIEVESWLRSHLYSSDSSILVGT